MNDETAALFIAPYIDKELNSVDMPELHSPYRDPEVEDDDEDE
jgi:hypothetical protein